jgi:hypothetical protein
VALIAAAACGCNEPSNPRSDGAAGSAVAGAAGSGGAAAAAGMGGAGLSDRGDAAADADNGTSGAGGGGGTIDGCPEPAPVPVEGQVIAIQSVKFSGVDPIADPAEIVLRNVSDADVTLVGGRENWQWCNVPAYWAIRESGNVTLAPGETYAFVPYYNTSGPRTLYRGDDPFEPNELGIYPASGTFDEADQILAFVSWGVSELDSRESIGVMGGKWTYDQHIAIRPGHAGFVATGPTNRASGYTSVPARCLVAPQNP